jgi:hypothetical protein
VSDDEIIVMVAGLFVSAWLVISWYMRLGIGSVAPYPGGWRMRLGFLPVGLMACILAVLLLASAQDVRSAPQYVVFYLILGTAWIFAWVRVMPLFGVSYRDDAVERRNPAAAVLIVSAMAAHTAIFSGANIGDGPGWWVVVFSGTIAAAIWYALWWAVEGVVNASEQVTVGRDLPAALRLGGYMIASGVVLGRAAAGDWVSADATIREFSAGWPALALAVVAIGLEKLLSRPARASASLGLAIGIAYILIGVIAVWQSPPLSQNPIYDQPGYGQPESYYQ